MRTVDLIIGYENLVEFLLEENKSLKEKNLNRAISFPMMLKKQEREFRKLAIREALSLTNGNVSKASRMLGISRTALFSIMHSHGIKAKESKANGE